VTQEEPRLPARIAGLIAKEKWSEQDWDEVNNYLDTDPPPVLERVVQDEWLRRRPAYRKELFASVNRPSKPERDPLSPEEEKRLLRDLLGPKSPERLTAFHRVWRSSFSNEFAGELATAYQESRDPWLRSAILDALTFADHELYPEMLRASLQSEDSEERARALTCLRFCKMHNWPPEPSLVEVLGPLRRYDAHPTTTSALYGLLGYFAKQGDSRCSTWLEEDALQGRSAIVQKQALGNLPESHPRLMEILVSLRGHPSPDVQTEIISRSGRLSITGDGNLRALELLSDMVRPDKDPEVNSRAARYLASAAKFLSHYKEPEKAISLIEAGLSAYLATNPPQNVSRRARETLETLSNRKR
jgi:hypothetical protein